jgi:hypothetical protein
MCLKFTNTAIEQNYIKQDNFHVESLDVGGHYAYKQLPTKYVCNIIYNASIHLAPSFLK